MFVALLCTLVPIALLVALLALITYSARPEVQARKAHELVTRDAVDVLREARATSTERVTHGLPAYRSSASETRPAPRTLSYAEYQAKYPAPCACGFDAHPDSVAWTPETPSGHLAYCPARTEARPVLEPTSTDAHGERYPPVHPAACGCPTCAPYLHSDAWDAEDRAAREAYHAAYADQPSPPTTIYAL